METPGSQTSLHRANLERVVRAVRMAGSLTQAEIARSTGLSAATVSNIVRELKDGGTVEVTPTSAGGRRARSVSLSGDAGIVIGVDFGHTHLRVAIGNLAHQVLAEESEPLDVDASSAQGFGRAEQLVNRLVETTGISPGKVIGVGLGVPGPIDVESGTLGSTSILPGWTGINPSQELAGRLGVPVYVDNDANLGALGELVWGSGRGVKDLAYIKVASGVGAGLVIDGTDLPGPRRHGRRDRAHHARRVGPRVPLRQPRLPGDLHRRPLRPAPAPAQPRGRSDHGADGPAGPRGRPGLPPGHRGRRPAHRQRRGEPVQSAQPEPGRARRGSLAEAGELVLGPIRESVSRYAIPSAARQLSVLPGALGGRAEVLGALALVLSEMGDSTLLESTLPRGRLLPSLR